jgi:hypothetical protein
VCNGITREALIPAGKQQEQSKKGMLHTVQCKQEAGHHVQDDAVHQQEQRSQQGSRGRARSVVSTPAGSGADIKVCSNATAAGADTAGTAAAGGCGGGGGGCVV